MFSKKLNMKITLSCLMVLVVAIILIFTFKGCNSSDGNYSKPKLPDLQFENNNGYTSNTQENQIVIPAVTGIVVKSDTVNQTLNISNPSNNKYAFVVDIFLSDGTKVYTSDYINPSDTITDAEFNTQLKAGLYKNALMTYTCYTINDQHTPLSRYEFPIEIRSLSE